MDIQKTVCKRAWRQIKLIQTASNMLEVEDAIYWAIIDTFRLKHLGLVKVSFDNISRPLLRAASGSAKYQNFDLLKAMREYNRWKYETQAKAYLFSFIPERLHNSRMYKNMVETMLLKQALSDFTNQLANV